MTRKSHTFRDMNKSPEDIDDAPFNMAAIFYVRLDNLMNAKSKAFVDQDLDRAYRLLKEIYKALIFKISQKDKDKIKENLQYVSKQLTGYNMGHIANEVAYNSITKCFEKLDETDEILTMVLDKHKMIFPKIQINGLSKLREKYDLEGFQDE